MSAASIAAMSGSDLRPGLPPSWVPPSGPSSSRSSSWVAGKARFLLRLPPAHDALATETQGSFLSATDAMAS